MLIPNSPRVWYDHGEDRWFAYLDGYFGAGDTADEALEMWEIIHETILPI